MDIEKKDIYNSLPTLIQNAESISWNRFNNFLVFNSILVLTWGAIYAKTDGNMYSNYMLLLCIAFFGITSGIFFSCLGYRGRKNVFECLNVGVSLENSIETQKPFTIFKNLSENNMFGWSSSLYILSIGPLIFSFFYLFLLHIALIDLPVVRDSITFIIGMILLLVMEKIFCAIHTDSSKKGVKMKRNYASFTILLIALLGALLLGNKYIEALSTGNAYQIANLLLLLVALFYAETQIEQTKMIKREEEIIAMTSLIEEMQYNKNQLESYIEHCVVGAHKKIDKTKGLPTFELTKPITTAYKKHLILACKKQLQISKKMNELYNKLEAIQTIIDMTLQVAISTFDTKEKLVVHYNTQLEAMSTAGKKLIEELLQELDNIKLKI